MTGKEVLSNITYFLQTVLPEAYSSGKWTSESVDQAFLWAAYCEKVYKSAVSQPKADQLDSCIKAIGIQLEGEQTNISLEYLKFSPKVLLMGFLENRMVESSVLQHALDQGKQNGINTNQLIEETAEKKELFRDVLQVFSTSKDDCLSIVKEIEAEFVVGNIKRKITYKTEPEAEKCLLEILKCSCETKHQIEIFLYVMVLEFQNSSVSYMLQRFFIAYLLQRITIGHDLFNLAIAQNVWKQPVQLLRSVASKHLLFYRCYIDTLIHSCRLMELKIENHLPKWKMKYSVSVPSFSFKEIVTHFNSLCNAQDKAAKSSQNLLCSLVEKPEESAVWAQILYYVRTDSYITDGD